MVIESAYQPRTPLHVAIHQQMDAHRFGAVVTHRRFGKTVLSLNHLILSCLENKRRKPEPRYGFIQPFLGQVKLTAWQYLLDSTANIPGCEPLVSELKVTLPTGGYVRLFGADNPQAFRGGYFDGVIMDEYAKMAPYLFSQIIRPTLTDFLGFCFFLDTPQGMNDFKIRCEQAQIDPKWFYACHKASETNIIPEEELLAAQRDMTADEYQQEYECSFEAAIKGAIYSDQLAQARADGRVTRVPYEPTLPVDTDWDLGVGDSTAIWFTQSLKSGEIRVIDFYESSGEGLPHYAGVLKAKPYGYGQHWAPHDIQVREFTSGRSRLEAAASLGIRFQVQPKHPIEEGIHAARLLFPKCWFDADKCKAGLEALQHYRRDFNTRLNEFKAAPVHDWACFTSDTEVLTRHGTYQIMNLPENGEVLTPCGWKQYQGPRKTRADAQLVAVTLSDGSTVRCTPDHQWLTVNGWTCAEHLQPTTEIHYCSTASLSISMGHSTDSGRMNVISPRGVVDFIGMSGLQHLAQFQPALTSITSTMTQPITHWETYDVCLPLTTVPLDMWPVILTDRANLPSPALRNGTVLRRADSGIADKPNAPSHGRSGGGWNALASIALRWFRWLRGHQDNSRSIAAKPAKPLRIVSVSAVEHREDTWCIHVPDVECFALANGAIVHNSHSADAWRGLAVRHKPAQERVKHTAPPPPASWLG